MCVTYKDRGFKMTNAQWMERLNLYISKLGASEEQSLWLKGKVIERMLAAHGGEAPQSVRLMRIIQDELSNLHGDELETRLAITLPLSGKADKPSKWLTGHVSPAIRRSSMASNPFVRRLDTVLMAECKSLLYRMGAALTQTVHKRIPHFGVS
jgi:hypothetical protein